MKAGWEIKSFAEIAEVKGGKRLPKGYSLQSIPTAHSYITVSDFTDDGTVDISRIRYISDEVFEEIKRYTISTKDLYLSIAGTIGKTGRIPPELDGANLTENACKLVFHPKINRDYVYYFTLSNDFIEQAGVHTRTAAQPKLALERLKTIKLAIPNSEAEQQRIVAILDEAFEAIAVARANAEQNRQNARALFESYLQSVFSQRGDEWVEKALEDTVDQYCSLSYGIVQPGDDMAEGLPIVRPTDLGIKVIELNGLKRIDTNLAKSYRKTTLRGNDLLLCVRGTTGMISIASQTLIGGNVTRGIVPIQFDKLLLSQEFGYYLMQSELVQSQIREKTYGTALMQINIRDLRKLTVYIPPLQEQAELVMIFDAIWGKTVRLESLYQRKIAALDELKQSLLQQAFSGQL